MKKYVSFLTLLLACILFSQIGIHAADKGTFSTSPTTNNGKKWRIGYYEGGDYIDYQETLIATVKGLMDLGWIEQTVIPPQKGEQTKDLWNWLTSSVKSEFIEFVKDAHYNSNWDDNLRGKIAKDIIKRLNQQKDIDLMIAMGTWAGKDLSNDMHQTPTMVLTASDAVGAGIIKSIEDSGFDHVQAHVDPLRYERQVRIFHEMVGFNRLGVAYEDSVDGRSYAAIGLIEKVAKEQNFEIIRCYTKSDVSDVTIAEESVKKCFSELVEKSDAIYVTVQQGVSIRNIPKLAEIVNSKKIPSFSQSGSEEVKYGFLASISRMGFKYVGRYHAETFAKVFNGAKPRQLDQVFEGPPKIALNLKTAEEIGFDPPIDLLLAADEMFSETAISQ